MRRILLLCSVIGAMATPAAAAPWVRSFVVSNYEPAFYYAAKLGGTENPGSDCPKGTIPDNDYKVVLKTKWRSDAEIAAMLDPRSSASGTGGEGQGLQYRGFRKDIDTYLNPFAAPDPGMQEVTGKIAEGFDLDGNAKTGGFTSPDGEKGVDNAFYRAWGCIMSYRGTPYHAYLSMRANDKMLDGMYTMVVRVSGNKDAMNDDQATVEIGYSPDHVVKDALGHVAADYSFRMAKTQQYTKLKARIKNGVVETEQVADLRAPEFSWGETNRGEADFRKGKLRLVMGRDGSASGLIGGYRDWRDLFGKDTFNVPSEGSTREIYYHENQIAMYYALKRNADGMTDPKTGEKMGISITYRFTAKPAYLVETAIPATINEPPIASTRAQRERDLFIKATMTKAISPAVGSKVGGDYDPGDGGRVPFPAAKADGDLQVDNGAPSVLVSATR